MESFMLFSQFALCHSTISQIWYVRCQRWKAHGSLAMPAPSHKGDGHSNIFFHIALMAVLQLVLFTSYACEACHSYCHYCDITV